MSRFFTICCPVHTDQRVDVLPGGGGWCRWCGKQMVPETEVFKREGTD